MIKVKHRELTSGRVLTAAASTIKRQSVDKRGRDMLPSHTILIAVSVKNPEDKSKETIGKQIAIGKLKKDKWNFAFSFYGKRINKRLMEGILDIALDQFEHNMLNHIPFSEETQKQLSREFHPKKE